MFEFFEDTFEVYDKPFRESFISSWLILKCLSLLSIINRFTPEMFIFMFFVKILFFEGTFGFNFVGCFCGVLGDFMSVSNWRTTSTAKLISVYLARALMTSLSIMMLEYACIVKYVRIKR